MEKKSQFDKMFELNHALYALAAIALVIGVVLMLTYVVQDEREVDSDFDRLNLQRATLFLLLAFTLAIFALVQRGYDVVGNVRHHLGM